MDEPIQTTPASPKPPFDPDAPLEPIEGEENRPNMALRDYCLMGPGRSLDKLVERYSQQSDVRPPTRRHRTLCEWSRTFHWVARAARFDRIQADAELAKWEARKLQLREEDWKLGDDLRRRVDEFIAELPKFIKTTEKEIAREGPLGPDGQPTSERVVVITIGLNTSLIQLAQTGQVASSLQRLAADEPTSHIKIHGAALDTAIERALAELANAGQASVPGTSMGETGGASAKQPTEGGTVDVHPVGGETPADQG